MAIFVPCMSKPHLKVWQLPHSWFKETQQICVLDKFNIFILRPVLLGSTDVAFWRLQYTLSTESEKAPTLYTAYT